MKKIILSLIATISISNFSFGQVTLEHSYSNPSSISTDDLFFTFNSANGINYYTFNKTTNIVEIYNENHILTNTFTVPTTAGYTPVNVMVTDKLFNNDNAFEFLITLSNYPNDKMILVNDSGTQIQEFNNRSFAKIVKNNSGAYKLIVKNTSANIVDIYSLPGTLSVNQQNLVSNKIVAYPNPTNDVINITNKYSNSTNGLLEVFNINGQKVIEQNISNNIDVISLNVSDLSSGVYIYKLNGETNKFIKK